jgi:hypothetical protein
VDERLLFENGSLTLDCRDKKTICGLKQSIYTKLNLFIEFNDHNDDQIISALQKLNIVMFFESIDGILEDEIEKRLLQELFLDIVN